MRLNVQDPFKVNALKRLLFLEEALHCLFGNCSLRIPRYPQARPISAIARIITFDGASPSGKAAAFGAAIRWFESNRPSRFPPNLHSAKFRMRVSVENTPAEIKIDSIAEAVNAAGNLIAIRRSGKLRVRFVNPRTDRQSAIGIQRSSPDRPISSRFVAFGCRHRHLPSNRGRGRSVRGWDLDRAS